MLRAFEIYCETCGVNEEWDDHIPGINEAYVCSSCGEQGRRIFSSPALNGLTGNFLDVADRCTPPGGGGMKMPKSPMMSLFEDEEEESEYGS